jgi:TfoX/Sxy family transcriptional regulator of competence genes
MKLQKSPPELVDLFASVMPGAPATERKMFGFPAGFVNGNMFMGLFQDQMILRLPENARREIVGAHNGNPFEPVPGRPMKEYVSVPPAMMKNRKELEAWVGRALEYGSSLKPKAKAKKAAKAKKKSKSR